MDNLWERRIKDAIKNRPQYFSYGTKQFVADVFGRTPRTIANMRTFWSTVYRLEDKGKISVCESCEDGTETYFWGRIGGPVTNKEKRVERNKNLRALANYRVTYKSVLTTVWFACHTGDAPQPITIDQLAQKLSPRAKRDREATLKRTWQVVNQLAKQGRLHIIYTDGITRVKMDLDQNF